MLGLNSALPASVRYLKMNQILQLRAANRVNIQRQDGESSSANR